MAIPKIKATYSLDESTVRKLEEIARKWETSRSAALSRLINQAEVETDDADIKRKLAALDEYARIMNLTPAQVKKWQRESRQLRHSWTNPWDERDAR